MASSPRVGKYRLLKRLAAGGMAEVFLAEAEGAAGFYKTVVLKRILPHLAEDPAFVRMFLAEARLASQLSHPNINHIFDLGESRGTYYLAMEFVDGMDVRSIIHAVRESKRTMPIDVALRIVSMALEALSYAHDFLDPQTGVPLELVHRDVTPDNILVSRQGGVKLVDFGIAKAASQPHLTEAGVLKGKVPYMAPEQLLSEPLNRQTDLFALGVVLFEMLALARPFVAANEPKLMVAILENPPLPLKDHRPDAPGDLQDILDKALAKKREDRYADAAAMQRDVDALLVKRGVTVSARDLGEFIKPLAPTSEVSGRREPVTGTAEKPITLVKRKAPKVVEPPVEDPAATLSDEPPTIEQEAVHHLAEDAVPQDTDPPTDHDVLAPELPPMAELTMALPGRKGRPGLAEAAVSPSSRRGFPLVWIVAGVAVFALGTVWWLQH